MRASGCVGEEGLGIGVAVGVAPGRDAGVGIAVAVGATDGTDVAIEVGPLVVGPGIAGVTAAGIEVASCVLQPVPIVASRTSKTSMKQRNIAHASR